MLFYYKNKHLQPNTTSKKCQLKHCWILTARILPVQLPKRAQIPPFESPRTGYTWSTAKDLVMSTRPGPNLCQSPDLSLLRLFGHLQLSHFSRQSQQRNQVKTKRQLFSHIESFSAMLVKCWSVWQAQWEHRVGWMLPASGCSGKCLRTCWIKWYNKNTGVKITSPPFSKTAVCGGSVFSYFNFGRFALF